MLKEHNIRNDFGKYIEQTEKVIENIGVYICPGYTERAGRRQAFYTLFLLRQIRVKAALNIRSLCSACKNPAPVWPLSRLNCLLSLTTKRSMLSPFSQLKSVLAHVLSSWAKEPSPVAQFISSLNFLSKYTNPTEHTFW